MYLFPPFLLTSSTIFMNIGIGQRKTFMTHSEFNSSARSHGRDFCPFFLQQNKNKGNFYAPFMIFSSLSTSTASTISEHGDSIKVRWRINNANQPDKTRNLSLKTDFISFLGTLGTLNIAGKYRQHGNSANLNLVVLLTMFFFIWVLYGKWREVDEEKTVKIPSS